MADRVMAWINSSLGVECAGVAGRAAAIIGGDQSRELTIQELADEVDADFLSVLIWLAAGAVAGYGQGDVGWCRGEGDNGPGSAGD
jgi:hypothetical protein